MRAEPQDDVNLLSHAKEILNNIKDGRVAPDEATGLCHGRHTGYDSKCAPTNIRRQWRRDSARRHRKDRRIVSKSHHEDQGLILQRVDGILTTCHQR